MDYQEKKQRVSDKVKHDKVTHKTKVIIKNAKTATRNPRAFWKLLSKSMKPAKKQIL